MKLLLDTHAFVWWASNSAKLPAAVSAHCSDPTNTLLLSVVSVWEMQIKIQLGKLKVSRPLPDLVKASQAGEPDASPTGYSGACAGFGRAAGTPQRPLRQAARRTGDGRGRVFGERRSVVLQLPGEIALVKEYPAAGS